VNKGPGFLSSAVFFSIIGITYATYSEYGFWAGVGGFLGSTLILCTIGAMFKPKDFL
jgi:hypothetical protein